MMWFGLSLMLIAAGLVLLAVGRTGLLRDALGWLGDHWKPALAVALALVGGIAWARRKPARAVKPGSLALEFHDLEVRRAEKAKGASDAHRKEAQAIRQRVEEKHGVHARVELDRQTYLADMVLDDAARELRQRSEALGPLGL